MTGDYDRQVGVVGGFYPRVGKIEGGRAGRCIQGEGLL